jgi:negative regulator of sigma E activity
MIDQTERLSAYLDGALLPQEMNALERELQNDPALAEALAKMAATDDTVRAAFDGPMHEPVPDRLTSLLAKPAESGTESNVIDFAAARTTREARKTLPSWLDWRAGAAIAATLVVGAFTVSQLSHAPTNSADALQVALNTSPSGAQVALSDGRTFTARLSFSAADGRYCREFAVGLQDGIACKGGDIWKIEAIAKGAVHGEAGGGYATAGGSTALDAAYERLGAGDPIAVTEEKALISNKWRKAPGN